MATSDDLKALKALKEGQDAIRGLLEEMSAKLTGNAPPVDAGPLAGFVRPLPGEPRHGEGKPMTAPDVREALERARHGVTWAGTVAREGKDLDDVWETIEKLRAGDWATIQHYAMLDPLLCVVGLLTGLFQLAKHDGNSFGVTSVQRRAFAGVKFEEFLNNQFGITGGPGIG